MNPRARMYRSTQRIRGKAEGDSRVSRFFFCPLPSAHESEGTLLELSDRSDKHPDAGRRTKTESKERTKEIESRRPGPDRCGERKGRGTSEGGMSR